MISCGFIRGKLVKLRYRTVTFNTAHPALLYDRPFVPLKFFTIWESDSQIVNEYMIQRAATKQVISLASQFKSLAIAVPRQSGKTTLAKYVFKTKP